ncbi:hypothetical protein BLA29_003329, partial [Euroglyphus maynei]
MVTTTVDSSCTNPSTNDIQPETGTGSHMLYGSINHQDTNTTTNVSDYHQLQQQHSQQNQYHIVASSNSMVNPNTSSSSTTTDNNNSTAHQVTSQQFMATVSSAPDTNHQQQQQPQPQQQQQSSLSMANVAVSNDSQSISSDPIRSMSDNEPQLMSSTPTLSQTQQPSVHYDHHSTNTSSNYGSLCDQLQQHQSSTSQVPHSESPSVNVSFSLNDEKSTASIQQQYEATAGNLQQNPSQIQIQPQQSNVIIGICSSNNDSSSSTNINAVSTQNQPSMNIVNQQQQPQQQRQVISGGRNESHSQQSQSICMVVPHNNTNSRLADTIPVTLTTGNGAIRPLCVITDSTPEQISASNVNFSTPSKKIFFSTSMAASTNTNTSISQPTLLFASKSPVIGQTTVQSPHVVNQNQIMIIPSNFSLNHQSHQQQRFKVEGEITDKTFVPNTSNVEQNFHSNESMLPRQYSSTSSNDSLNNNCNNNRYQNNLSHIAPGSQRYDGVAQNNPTTPTLIQSGSTQFPLSGNYSVLQLPPGQLSIGQHQQTQTLGKAKILLHSLPAANISGAANASATLLTLNSGQLQPLQTSNN